MRHALFLILCLLAPFDAMPQCVPVAGPSVLAVDLVSTISEFRSLAPRQILMPAPKPGVRRLLKPLEVAQIARRHGISLTNPASLCIERRSQTLDPADLKAALLRAWSQHGGPLDANLELLDFARLPVPPGDIEFGPPPTPSIADCQAGAPLNWRGRLRYDGTQSFPIWASVRVHGSRQVLLFAKDLPAGAIIDQASITTDPVECAVLPHGALSDSATPLGRVLRAAVRKGDPVRLQQLAMIKEIDRGDLVSVRIEGIQHVQIRAVALTSGRRGDKVTLQNPLTGARFQALVAASREATLSQEPLHEKRR
jgi:flagella basal body P-ring formation protein FlgA